MSLNHGYHSCRFLQIWPWRSHGSCACNSIAPSPANFCASTSLCGARRLTQESALNLKLGQASGSLKCPYRSGYTETYMWPNRCWLSCKMTIGRSDSSQLELMRKEGGFIAQHWPRIIDGWPVKITVASCCESNCTALGVQGSREWRAISKVASMILVTDLLRSHHTTDFVACQGGQ